MDNDLKEDEVNEEEEEPGPTKPEEVIAGLNHRRALDHISPLLDLDRHLRDDHLELGAHQ